MMKRTWYYRGGSKKAELWTILHLPYTTMCLSFLIIGFSIQKPVNFIVMLGAVIAYFAGLGISAHAFDQLPGMGTTYVEYLSLKDILILGVVGLALALGLGSYFTICWKAWHMIWLMPFQVFFAVAYPVSKLFKGFFHNDFWFSVGFGFMPVTVGYYANTLSFSWLIIPFGLLCFLIAAIEITLSRYVRKMRVGYALEDYIVNHPSLKEGACFVRSKGNWLIRELKKMFEKTQQKLSGELKNTPTSASLACSSVSSGLNKEETLSVQNKVLTDNNPEENQSQHRGSSDLRVQNIVYALNSTDGDSSPSLRKESSRHEEIKPERALKLLCLLSYVFAGTMLLC